MLNLRPSSAPYISGDSFRAIADFVYEPQKLLVTKARSQPNGLPLVFVEADDVKSFFANSSRLIGSSYVLITHNGDTSIDDSYFANLDRNLVHWFAHNLLAKHERATCIPIGLENARLHYNGIVSDFDHLRRTIAKYTKEPRILAAFTVGNNPGEREPALKALRNSRLSVEITRTNSRIYRNHLSRFMFVASPAGNGFDCHRTWEALYLGVIPIVKRHTFFDQFPGLPLLQLGEWEDLLSLSEKQLIEVYSFLSAKLDPLPIIWMDYWKNRIDIYRKLTA